MISIKKHPLRCVMYAIAGKRLLLSCADVPQRQSKDLHLSLSPKINNVSCPTPAIMIDIPTYRIFTYTVAFSEACVTLLLMDEQ